MCFCDGPQLILTHTRARARAQSPTPTPQASSCKLLSLLPRPPPLNFSSYGQVCKAILPQACHHVILAVAVIVAAVQCYAAITIVIVGTRNLLYVLLLWDVLKKVALPSRLYLERMCRI